MVGDKQVSDDYDENIEYMFGVMDERKRIIKLLNNDDLVPRLNTPQGNWAHLDTLLALIKGENK